MEEVGDVFGAAIVGAVISLVVIRTVPEPVGKRRVGVARGGAQEHDIIESSGRVKAAVNVGESRRRVPACVASEDQLEPVWSSGFRINV